MTIHAIKVLAFATVLSVMWLDSELATAKVVRWYLQNVRFDDGATGSGFFLWDADASPAKHLVNWNIAIVGGTLYAPDYTFTPNTSTFWFNGRTLTPNESFTVVGPKVGTGIHCCHQELTIGFESAPSDAGGTIGMGGSHWWFPSDFQPMTTGQIAAIPEASYALFLAVGLITLVSLSARRKRVGALCI